MTSFGETLRRERLKRNLELAQIAEELKISSRFLEAIEAEQLQKLPGGVFTKSFVLQYARLLGVDEERIAGEVQRVLEPPPELPEFVETPKPENSGIRVPRVEEWQAVGGGGFRWLASLAAAALVIAVILACSALYTWWQRARTPAPARETPPAAAVQLPPTQPAPQPPAPSTAAPGESAPAPSAAQNPAAQPVSGASAPAPSMEQATPPAKRPGPEGGLLPAAVPSEVTPGPGAPPGAPPASASASNPSAPVRVEVTAGEPVWIRAQSDGKHLFSSTLAAGQSRVIEANSAVLLLLGNAGGVTITLNGKPIGPVGPRGQVRTVQLTSGGFEIVASPKSPVPPEPL